MPALRFSVPSGFTSMTSAFTPMEMISTVSPARTSREDFFSSFGSSGLAAFILFSDSLSLRRSSLLASFTLWASSSSFALRRISSSSAKVSSAVCLASAIMRSASRRDFSSAFSSRTASSARKNAAFLALSSASRSFTAASALSRSSISRVCSSFSMVASKLAFCTPTRALASSIISSPRPSRFEMAKAFDLPGMPTSSL